MLELRLFFIIFLLLDKLSTPVFMMIPACYCRGFTWQYLYNSDRLGDKAVLCNCMDTFLHKSRSYGGLIESLGIYVFFPLTSCSKPGLNPKQVQGYSLESGPHLVIYNNRDIC